MVNQKSKGISMIIVDLLKAMKAGEEIGNPAKWKTGQNKASIIGVIVALALKYAMPDSAIPEEVVDWISNGIFFIVIAVNYFLTIATTKKIGITSRKGL